MTGEAETLKVDGPGRRTGETGTPSDAGASAVATAQVAAAGPSHWLGLLPEEIGEQLATLGEPPYRGLQVFAWFHRRQVTDFERMTDLPRELRHRLAAAGSPALPVLRQRQVDPVDCTRKYLLELADGQLIETVLMRYRYGLSLCVSTQVGCRMGCRFCASTLGGLVRNLTAAEMAAQLIVANRDVAPERVSHLVLMGIGEPLENLEEVLRFLRIAHHPRGAGIGYRHMTVSTSGLVPQIHRLAQEGLPITLAVSLHAPNDPLRSRLMPVNRRWPMGQLLAACRQYVQATGRRITFEYVLLAGVNDRPEQAEELASLLRGFPCHVNLIPWNPVDERSFQAPSPEGIRAFYRVLRARGIPVTVRRSLGQRIDAACGQLRRRASRAASTVGRPTFLVTSGIGPGDGSP